MNKKASLKSSLGQFTFALLLFFSFRWIGYEPYVIPSGSMIPTLLVHDHIVVNKYQYGFRLPFSRNWVGGVRLPKRGEIVVFRSVESDDYFMIKRVIGLPGDKIKFTTNGELLINGIPLPTETINGTENWSEVDLGDSPQEFKIMRETIGDISHAILIENGDFHSSYEEKVVPEGKIFLSGDNRDRSRDSRFWGELPLENLLGRAEFVWLSCTDTIMDSAPVCDPSRIRWDRIFHKIE